MVEQYKSLKKQLKGNLADIEVDFEEFNKNTDLGSFRFLTSNTIALRTEVVKKVQKKLDAADRLVKCALSQCA